MKKFLWEGVHRIVFAMEDLDKPVIAAINADCLGGGLEIETGPSAGTTIKISVPLERVKGRAPELS